MPHNKIVLRTVLVASVFTLVALAGCLGNGDGDSRNVAPDAKLSVDRDNRWTNETFTFRSESDDSDGEIATWRYDFGDGIVMEFSQEDEAREVDHSYMRGGEFIATLTVTDDGAENVGAKSDTSQVEIIVDERNTYLSPSLFAPPVDASSTANYTEEFEVFNGVNGVELDFEVQSTVPFGSSEVLFEIFDPQGEKIASKQVTVDAGEEESLLLKEILDDDGTYKIVMTVESGGAVAEGEYRVYYSAFEFLEETTEDDEQ